MDALASPLLIGGSSNHTETKHSALLVVYPTLQA